MNLACFYQLSEYFGRVTESYSAHFKIRNVNEFLAVFSYDLSINPDKIVLEYIGHINDKLSMEFQIVFLIYESFVRPGKAMIGHLSRCAKRIVVSISEITGYVMFLRIHGLFQKRMNPPVFCLAFFGRHSSCS